WPSVPGRITSTKMVMSTGRYGSMAPDVRYTYSVGTSEFNGSRLEIVTYSSNTSYASDALAEFREGSEVPVYFDPTRPECSVLRRGPNWVAYGLPLVSALMILFGVWLVRLFVGLSRTLPRGGLRTGPGPGRKPPAMRGDRHGVQAPDRPYTHRHDLTTKHLQRLVANLTKRQSIAKPSPKLRSPYVP